MEGEIVIVHVGDNSSKVFIVSLSLHKSINIGRIIIYAALRDLFFSYVLLYRMVSMVWADSGTSCHYQRARRRNFLGLSLLP